MAKLESSVCSACGRAFVSILYYGPRRGQRQQFCSKLCANRRPRRRRTHFWDYVEPEPNTGCWLWLGRITYAGYGAWRRDGYARAHRYAYAMRYGAIPDGLTLDHRCRVRSCVNPAHLEPMTPRENILRGEGHAARNALKTQCPRGHPYDYIRKEGRYRWCRTCLKATREPTRRETMAKPKYLTENPDKATLNAQNYEKSLDPQSPPDSEYTAAKAKSTGPETPKKAPRNKG
jgi:HNH endonuclease